MVNIILQTLYFLLPYALANMAPPLVKKVKVLERPVDFGKKIGNKRVLGDNKTWRGVAAGIIGALIGVYLQSYLYNTTFFRELSIINFSDINILLLGILIGAGTMIGDSAGSFIKRRLSVGSGERFLVLDQIVGPVGMLIFISPLVTLSLEMIGLALILSFLCHIIIKHLGYWLKIEEKKW